MPQAAAATMAKRDQIPDWLQQDLFVDILQKDLKQFKSIKSFDVGAATNAGDNYASIMLKIDIVAELQGSYFYTLLIEGILVLSIRL